MELMLIIGTNNNMNDVERSEIIVRTLNIYFKMKKEERLNFQKVNHQVKLQCWNQKRTAMNA